MLTFSLTPGKYFVQDMICSTDNGKSYICWYIELIHNAAPSPTLDIQSLMAGTQNALKAFAVMQNVCFGNISVALVL